MLIESIALFGLALSALSSSRASKGRKLRERLFGVPVPPDAATRHKGESELFICVHGLDLEEHDPEELMIPGHVREDGAICYPYHALYDMDSPIEEIIDSVGGDEFSLHKGEPFGLYLDKMDERGIRYELIGPWRLEREFFEAAPRTLWRVLGVDSEGEVPETVTMEPRLVEDGMVGEETDTPRVCTAPSPELCLIGASPSGRAIYGDFAFYVNRNAVAAVRPTQLELPDQPITGEIWLTEPAVFELAFVLTERQSEILDDFMREMAETDTDNTVKILRGINDRLRRWGYLV